MKLLSLILIIAFSLIVKESVLAQTPIQVELMASEISWANSEYAGHAFMCISLPTNSGIKEDCYGFYPKDTISTFIGGPGVTNSEFRKSPSRYSRVTVSMKKTISAEQRRKILKLVDDWSEKDYRLTHQSCIDFVNSVAKTLKWKTPERNPFDLPEKFLTKLKQANK